MATSFNEIMDHVCDQYTVLPRLDVIMSSLVVRSAFRGRQQLNRVLKPYDLNAWDFWVLMFVHEQHASASPSLIGEMFGISRVKMTRILDNLEDKQLLCRIPNQDDRRGLCLQTTEQGAELIANITNDIAPIYQQMWQPLTDREKSQVIHLFNKILP